MKHITHDWDDERATTILRHCREAVNPGGKLLLVETVVAPDTPVALDKLMDLEMRAIPGGRERTVERGPHRPGAPGYDRR